jgi:hypothetical protein
MVIDMNGSKLATLEQIPDNQFYAETFNPYLDFHRPRYFAVDTFDAKGKIKKTYPHELICSPIKDYALHLKVA